MFYGTNVLYLCKIDTCKGGYHTEDVSVSVKGYPNQCVANTYSVTYKQNKPSNASNDVQGTTAESSHVYDVGSALTTNGYSLTGWDFVNWNKLADGSGDEYKNGADVYRLTTTNGGTVTLYAQWKPKETVLLFDNNAEDATAGAPQSYIAKYDNAMPNTNIKLPTRQGYTFKGYFDKATGGTKYYNANGTSARTWNKTDDPVTLYAQWDKCAKGYYCQGDNSKLSCPDAFYSDAGATYITQCYLRTDIKLTDKFDPTGTSLFTNVSTPDDSKTEKIYYIGDNN